MRRLAFALALLAVLALPVGAAAAGSPVPADTSVAGESVQPSADRASVESDAFAQQSIDAEATMETDITVQLRANRDARWQVEMRYPLTSDTEVEAFRRYGDAFERGDADGTLEASTFEYLADASSTVATRQMSVRNVSRSATVTGDTGVLRLSFTWTAFLSGDGEYLVLRDAFRLPNDRTWLATLGPTQQLVIETPPGYTINATNAPVVQRSGAVVIDGPRTFDTGDSLMIRYEPTTDVAGYPWELVAGVGVAFLVVLAMLARRRQGSGSSLLDDDSDPDAPAGAATGATSETDVTGAGTAVAGSAPDAAPERQSSETEPAGVGGNGRGIDGAGAGGVGTVEEAGDGAAEGAAEPDTAGTDDPDLSLLSDAERVEHLLDRNGGRMRQTEIVEATGWSDAKVSQLLSSMAEEERIEKLRLGRENLISLPEEDAS